MADTAALVAGLTSGELIASAGWRLGVSVQRLADGALVAVLVAQEGGDDLTLEHVRTVLGTSMPCIGRERELGSRLRRELVSRIRQRDENVEAWLGFADPLMERAPFALIGELLRRVLGVVDGEELGTRREKIDAG